HAVASVQSASEHPIAHALLAAAQDKGLTLAPVHAFAVLTGAGVRGQVEDHDWLLGSEALLQAHGIVTGPDTAARLESLAAQGKTAFLAARDGRLTGVLAVADTLRPGAREAIDRLHALG